MTDPIEVRLARALMCMKADLVTVEQAGEALDDLKSAYTRQEGRVRDIQDTITRMKRQNHETKPRISEVFQENRALHKDLKRVRRQRDNYRRAIQTASTRDIRHPGEIVQAIYNGLEEGTEDE